MTNILSFSYWFSLKPSALSSLGLSILLIVAVFFAIFAALFSFLQKKSKAGVYKKLYSSLGSFFSYNLTIYLFILFFTYEEIVFLGARFWFLFWFLGMIFWLFFIFKYYKSIPTIKEQRQKDEEYKKYIP